MLEYLAVLLIGFWLGVAILLYSACYWLDEIFDLPSRNEQSSGSVAVSSDASGAHAQLKRLVARVVEEASALPALAKYAADPPRTPTLDSSTYEDLLATAILNKVIERYQTENGSGGRSSGIHSASASPSPSERSSPRSLNLRHNRDITPPLHEEVEDGSDWDENDVVDGTLELPRRVPFPEFGGDIVHATDNEDRDFDEVSGSDIQAVDGTWEENWLFQKKKIKTLQSVPVPMLVPNSNAEYRALIGDRDADDTTDLSDNASDAEEEAEFKSDIQRVVESKHIIGGQPQITNYEEDFEPDSLTILDDNYYGDEITDNGNDEIDSRNATVDTINQNLVTSLENKDSVLVFPIDSGPLPKAEFTVNEEIHRTQISSPENNLDSLEINVNGDVIAEIKEEYEKNREFSQNTLNGHEREGEYEETVTLPVQRYADSLRRKHFDDIPQTIPTRDTDRDEDIIVPGSIAERERKKWLNYVEMPNNPYSPEAIQKRLSAKSTSSLFDILTKTKDLDDPADIKSSKSTNDLTVNDKKPDDIPVKEENVQQHDTTDQENNIMNIHRNISPSPKILRDVLAEEVPQYKRYGRDYYIKEAKSSRGARKRGDLSDTNSMSPSLEHSDGEFASTVSASSSLSDLEAAALHHNISRAVLSPRNASPNFAINPIFENPDDTRDDPRTDRYNVRARPCAGDGCEENEDILRLKIPDRPETTEDSFESYTDVRRTNTLRSDDFFLRPKRRPALNFTFGGSLRLSKGFRTDLW